MKKIMLVSLALVLALGALGVGYAMWSDTVTVSGDIYTGKVDIDIAYELILDTYAPYDVDGDGDIDYMSPPFDWTVAPGFLTPPTQIDKNVAWGESVVSLDGDTDTVTLHNTYPCYFNNVNFYIVNVGTIPVVIWKTQIWMGTDTTGTPDWELTDEGYIAMEMDGDADGPEIEIQYGDNFGKQIEPGNTPLEISYGIHTLQAATQGTNYTFTFKIIAVQYNEYPPP